MSYYFSYLMGAKSITDPDLRNLNINIEGETPHGSRKLKIPAENVNGYIELVKEKLGNGFWNEIIGTKEIIFIFRFPDGSTKEYKLSLKNEAEIQKLCAEFNNEAPEKTANVYKYLSENDFYREFMTEHFSELINRP